VEEPEPIVRRPSFEAHVGCEHGGVR
jgi:hypothetical protein